MTATIEAVALRKEFTVTRKAGRLRRTRHQVAAVDGVDLRVERGELLGYLGPNGAGKSTTLKMLTGVLMPTSGSTLVCGLVPVAQRRALAARISVVFGQRSQLWWDLPLRDSFELARHIWRVPANDHAARLSRLRHELDLDEFLDTPVRQLSLGQRMRGELTIALLHGPEVLFLDEPTIGLDVTSKQAVRSFLTALRDRGDTTVVLTTHDLADIERLCKRLVVIDHGRVVHDGTLAALHERYSSRRRVRVELDEPPSAPIVLPGVVQENTSADGRLITYSLDGSGTTAGELVARLASVASLRDISVQEPAIEDVTAGVLAKVGSAELGDTVISTIRQDPDARQLYLTAVASRVLDSDWDSASQLVRTGSATLTDWAGDRLLAEIANPRDAVARWCSTVLLHQVYRQLSDATRSAFAWALHREQCRENLRAFAAVLAGASPLSV